MLYSDDFVRFRHLYIYIWHLYILVFLTGLYYDLKKDAPSLILSSTCILSSYRSVKAIQS